MERVPSSVARANLAGLEHAAAGRFKEAWDAFTAGIRLQPQAGVLDRNRGAALVDSGRADLALADFDRAHELEPALADVLQR